MTVDPPHLARRRPWRRAFRRLAQDPAGGRLLLAGLLVLFGLLAATLWNFPALAAGQLDEAAERALQAFALARGINAVISVIQDVEIGFTFGLAATLSPGEILDPVNDLVERFSLAMLVASALLWTLRLTAGLLLDPLLAWCALAFYLAGLALLSSRRPWLHAGGALGVRAALLMLVLAAYAFLTPLAINLVHGTAFVGAEYEAAAGAIGGARDQLETMNLEMETELSAEPGEAECEGVAGCLESLGGSVSALSRKLGDYSALGQRYQGYIEEATALADRISRQVVVQIAVFVLETLVIPLAGLWLAGLAIRGLPRF